jgi:hypothetical protein
MTKATTHTAVYRGKTYTLTTRGFCKIMGRSQTFVEARLNEGKTKENPMQYAIDDHEHKLKNSKNSVPVKKKAFVRITPAEKKISNRQDAFAKTIRKYIDGFLYPKNAEMTLRREYEVSND